MQHKMGNQETLDNGLNPPLNHHHYYVMVAIAGPKMLTILQSTVVEYLKTMIAIWASIGLKRIPKKHLNHMRLCE